MTLYSGGNFGRTTHNIDIDYPDFWAILFVDLFLYKNKVLQEASREIIEDGSLYGSHSQGEWSRKAGR